jgi:hypothetical protein
VEKCCKEQEPEVCFNEEVVFLFHWNLSGVPSQIKGTRTPHRTLPPPWNVHESCV